VARVIKSAGVRRHLHLSIEDLLAPPRDRRELPVRASSSSPETSTPRSVRRERTAALRSSPCIPNYAQSRGVAQFQLRLGIIESEPEADTLLAMVREHYPGRSRKAGDDDKAAIARAGCPAEPAKDGGGGAGREGTCRSSTGEVAPPAARQPHRSQQSIVYWTSMSVGTDDDKARLRVQGAPPSRQNGEGCGREGACRFSAKKSPASSRQAAQKPAKHWSAGTSMSCCGASRSAPARPRPTPRTSTASKMSASHQADHPAPLAKAQMPTFRAAPRAKTGRTVSPDASVGETRQLRLLEASPMRSLLTEGTNMGRTQSSSDRAARA